MSDQVPAPSEVVAFVRAGGSAFEQHADRATTQRGAGMLSIALALGVLVLLPLAAPSGAGAVGWVLAGTMVVLGLLIGARVLTGGEVSSRVTLAVACAWIVALDVLAGPRGPYSELVVLPVVFAGAAYDLRRFLGVLGLATLVTTFGLVGSGPVAIGEALVQVFVWASLGALGLMWTGSNRLQRRAAAEREDHAHALARLDPLTGLGNRRAFDELLRREIARAQRGGTALAVVVCDLNDFKEINDTHGHLAGDACLRQVAGAVASVVRRPDVSFRWGGDEFAVVLPETSPAAAARVAARIAAEVHRASFTPDGRGLTIGVGTAQHVPGEEADALVRRADLALLSVKELTATGPA